MKEERSNKRYHYCPLLDTIPLIEINWLATTNVFCFARYSFVSKSSTNEVIHIHLFVLDASLCCVKSGL